MAGKHRLVRIYQGMSKRAKAAVIGGVLVVGMAGGTLAASAATSATPVVPVSITNVTASELDFNGHGSYELQVVNQDTGKQILHTKSGGLVKVTGLAAGTAYEWRTVQGSHWGLFETAFTTAAAGSAGSTADLSPATESLIPSAIEANYGGSFTSKATLVGTVKLPDAGKYLVSLNAEATPSSAYTTSVFPQFFVYDGAPNADWTNDEFNIGSGSLESPTAAELAASDLVNSYYSGSSIVTVTGATTLNVYAFGYAADTSGGTYQLNAVVVSTVQVG